MRTLGWSTTAALVVAVLGLACDGDGEGVSTGAGGFVAGSEPVDAVAQRQLGKRYEDGVGLPQDPGQAAQWYRRAAEQGDAAAQYLLGSLYFYGTGVPRDTEEAFRWVRKSAEQGYADAEFGLAHIYIFGRGVERNVPEAMAWYTRAAEKGHFVAMHSLAMIRLTGSDAVRDEDAGRAWLLKAAESGHSIAQWRLALALETGEFGFEPDTLEARKWMLLSDAELAARSRMRLREIEKVMSAEELAESQRRVNEWRKQHATRATRADGA